MRLFQILGVAVCGSTVLSTTAQASLVGTAVTGSLRFVGNTNYFDPTNNRVPAGYGNASSATNVSIGDPQTEFGFQDEYGRITADFTATGLTIAETALTGTDAVIERYSFTDAAFAGLVTVQISNSYPVSASASIVDDRLLVSLPDGYSTTTGDTMTLSLAITLPGDADLNGQVDFNDFLALQTNFNQSSTQFQQGNFNGDSITDFNDFLILQTNFGQSLNGPDVAATADEAAAMSAFTSAAVPEPMMLGTVGFAGLLLMRRRV